MNGAGSGSACWLHQRTLLPPAVLLQLNVRKSLEERALPPINIICQKLGSEGLTRFEDRKRLPLGISVNLATFSAKMLAQVAHNPLAIQVRARVPPGIGYGWVLMWNDTKCCMRQWGICIPLVGDRCIGMTLLLHSKGHCCNVGFCSILVCTSSSMSVSVAGG